MIYEIGSKSLVSHARNMKKFPFCFTTELKIEHPNSTYEDIT